LKPPAPVVLKPVFPASSFVCDAAPTLAEQPTDVDLAVYLVELWGAWADCSDQLTSVGQTIQTWGVD
jgi:hypothetical protein